MDAETREKLTRVRSLLGNRVGSNPVAEAAGILDEMLSEPKEEETVAEAARRGFNESFEKEQPTPNQPVLETDEELY